jgi:putative nucleotidyltransferase with HDIG domain
MPITFGALCIGGEIVAMASASSGPYHHAHIVVMTDKGAQCDELVAVLRQVCPVRVLPSAADPHAIANTALCVVVDVDLASAQAKEEVELLRHLPHSPPLPLVFVIDLGTEKADLDRDLNVAKAFGAANYITRPFEQDAILGILPSAYGSAFERDAVRRDGTTGLGVAAAHSALSSILEVARTGRSFTFEDVRVKDHLILDALRISGIKAWLETVRRHHSRTYKHSLLVTGVAVAFAQKLGMRLEDQQRLAHAGLLHDVGKAFTPLSILDKPEKLTDDEMGEIKKHPVQGHELLMQQGGFPDEILDCVLHHHELLDGSGYPDGLKGAEIADLVRITTIADIFSALIEQRAYKPPLPPEQALETMQKMDGKLDADLLRAFQSVALDAS